MAAPAGLGVNFAHDSDCYNSVTVCEAQLSNLKSIGINKVRVNIPVYTTENENPSFRNKLRDVCTTALDMGFEVMWGYNAFPLNSSNRANFETQLRAGATWAASVGIQNWVVGNEEDLNTGYSQADLRTALKEVCQVIKVTDGFPGTVSTAITTNVYAAWESDVAVWDDYMKLDLHIYGGLAASHFDNYAKNVPPVLGALCRCTEFGVDSGRLAFSTDEAWQKEMVRRMNLLINNGWTDYYFFAYAVEGGDEETRWSLYRTTPEEETTTLRALARTRPRLINVS